VKNGGLSEELYVLVRGFAQVRDRAFKQFLLLRVVFSRMPRSLMWHPCPASKLRSDSIQIWNEGVWSRA
jgi:hypothetical protein